MSQTKTDITKEQRPDAIDLTRTYDGVTDLVPRDLWYVAGVQGEYFTTKMAAEVRARAAFPHETPTDRYARVFFKRFFEEV